MENKIAVIIPAYKDTYLLNTLISINNQTDKKFNLYICNDSSPYNIEKVLACLLYTSPSPRDRG